MPIALPSSSSGSCPVVPPLLRSTVQACRFSEWYPSFKRNSIRGVVYKFGKEEELTLRAWFEEDGMRLPTEVVEDDESQLSDSSDEDEEESSSSSSSSSSSCPPSHSFPSFTTLITSTLLLYPIFPKINNLAPQDAQWILPLSQPLKCTTIQDVYLALKASALTAVALDDHRDLSGVDEDDGTVVEGVVEDLSEEQEEGERVEVVLKKWYDLERSREFRLFVRGEVLLGISQRDPNHYPHLLVPETQSKIRSTLVNFFESTLKGKFAGGPNYVLDVYMSSSLTGAHLISIAPYHPSLTSPLLFGSYSALHQLYLSTLSDFTPPALSTLSLLDELSSATSSPTRGDEEDDASLETIGTDAPLTLPVLLVIESRSHPAATRNSPAWPAYPQDVVSVGSGKDVEEFKRIWEGEVREAAKEEQDETKTKTTTSQEGSP
ncbi:D123-domain-containing protein [Mrakia frigida]|uniref:cell proliferation protein CDC123 n=1 Tax=Mrakia frigida TaxID=29902 RepID=UPI003FCC185F